MPSATRVDEIPYQLDSCELFERLRSLPGAALLDSSFPHSNSGRFDIMTALPLSPAPPVLPASADEAQSRGMFDELRRYHAELFAGVQPVSADIPFCGGVLGCLGYESGNRLQAMQHPRAQAHSQDTSLAAYDWCVVQDHLRARAVLVTLGRVDAAVRADLLARLRSSPPARAADFHLDGPFRSNLSAQDYQGAFQRIQSYIHAGDCYQVNLAQRFRARYEGDPWHAYRALRAVAAAPFSAYLPQRSDRAIICLSPERFLALQGKHVETSPIKGTRPRYADTRADELAAEELRASSKERAENLMIVDLLRNDLGRSCLPGSIQVERLFELQSFPTVHHLVSTIRGELLPERGAWDLLRDSFPGGSVTGAPKRRAMQIIAELEKDPRDAYCGSIFYVSADGRMDSNIAIRTLVCDAGEMSCWGGGGIVADSNWQREYQEIFDKVGSFLTTLETLGKPTA